MIVGSNRLETTSPLAPISIFSERFGESRWFLAPMAGITDIVFRRLMRTMGADVVISELVSSEGLVRGGAKTRELMAFCDEERPVGIQIFGSDTQRLIEAARIVQEEGADFVDINFGCPVKKVVCDGAGAAWLREPQKMGEMLSAVKASLRIPLTIKVRTGWDETSRNVAEVVRVAADAGVAWVAIHGRTRAQGYSGSADWDLIRHVAHRSTIPVIGNGDLVKSDQAIGRLGDGYSHAVMIGRGALKNPWIFQEAKGIEPDYDFLSLIERHFDLALELKGRTRAFLSLKKFLAWYAAGFSGASIFRASIFQTKDVEQLRQLAIDYFGRFNHQRVVNDDQPFLMGGHG